MTQCARCGADPIFAPGIASRLINGKTVVAYFCHNADHEVPSCFLLSCWANFPELSQFVPAQ